MTNLHNYTRAQVVGCSWYIIIKLNLFGLFEHGTNVEQNKLLAVIKKEKCERSLPGVSNSMVNWLNIYYKNINNKRVKYKFFETKTLKVG